MNEVRDPRNSLAGLWLAGALLLGFALRLFRLGGESLWYDETVSVYLASQSFAELVAHTARDIHPPGYYLLLSLWRLLALPSRDFGLEFLYAWLSLFFDLLTIALTFAIARRTWGDRAAHWAIALVVFHPTQIWFAQEVRMYSLGAFFLMLSLWSVAPFFATGETNSGARLPRQTLILYPIAAILGLYTLYYFAFWLVVLVSCMIVRLWQTRRALLAWLALQVIVLLGWLPWMPIFYRQALSPPVPAWRVAWQTPGEILLAIREATAAHWIGHVPPFELWWPWAIGVLLTALAFFAYAKSTSLWIKTVWIVLAFGPVATMLLVSLVATPVYHVRYVSTYAPVFLLLLAALLGGIRAYSAAAVFSAFFVGSALSLHAMWTMPRYAADDHRGAVATLAAEWRPGEALLVNAGWAYTALAVYWPTDLPSASAARPPQIHQFVRLDAASMNVVSPSDKSIPIVYRTGSVGGDPNLGWQLPESDFFAVTATETTDALARLASQHPRIWHYRIYDTVSDPSGIIRQWLEGNATLEFRQSIPGRDFLMIERYRTNAPSPLQNTTAPEIHVAGTGVLLLGHAFSPTITAGETLYLGLTWDFSMPGDHKAAPQVALSLRLYDHTDKMLVQQDARLVMDATLPSTQILALPIPAGTPPDNYHVGLVIYSPANLAPFATVNASGVELKPPLLLGDLIVEPRQSLTASSVTGSAE